MDKVKMLFLRYCRGVIFLFCCAGCASVPVRHAGSIKPVETADQQLDAVQKVLGGMSGRDVSPQQMKKMTQDIQKNEDTRGVVGKIIGGGGAPVIKYSPATGKHYSGDLEVDPETGVKLEVLPE